MRSTKTFFLFLVLVTACAASGHAIGGPAGLMIAAAGSMALMLVISWFSDRFLLRLYDARAVGYVEEPTLYRTLQRLAQKAAIPMPMLYAIPERAPNAFATGRNPDHAAVVVTEGLLRLLNEQEVEAVLAYEVARIARRDTLWLSTVAALAGAAGSVVNFALWGTLPGAECKGTPKSLWCRAVTRVSAAVQRGLASLVRSHARSLAADRRASRLIGNPLWLANALEKIDAYGRQMRFYGGSREAAFLFIQNPYRGDGDTELFRTHPRTGERVSQLWRMARNFHRAA